MTSEGLGKMFEGDSADMCAGKFPLMSMGGGAEGLACADPGAKTPIGMSGNFCQHYHKTHIMLKHAFSNFDVLQECFFQGHQNCHSF